MGVFRYQEVATLAREGARYASTHGYQYRKDAGQAIGTASDWQDDIYTNGIKPRIIGFVLPLSAILVFGRRVR